MTIEQQIIDIQHKVKNAKTNMRRQYNREKKYGINSVHVRYTFWEQVIRDYSEQLNLLIKQKQ